MLNAVHILGQILLGGFFINAGINHFVKHKSMIGYAQFLKVPAPAFAIYFTGAMLLVGGLGVFFNVCMFISLIILVVFLVPVTFTAHRFWKETDPQAKMNSAIGFQKNIAILGALLLLMMW